MSTFLSLFSGCGGLDLGFIQAGYNCVKAVDKDASAVQSYNMNLHPVAEVGDLRSWEKLGLSSHKPDLVIAGPPCQGFSTAGNRDLDDDRNHLLLIPAEVAITTHAECVVIENVPGALVGKHQKYWLEADGRLRNAGFATRTLLVDAGITGLPQRRRRALLVASRAVGRIPDLPITPVLPKSLGTILPVPEGTPNHDPIILGANTRGGIIASRIRPGQKLCNVRAGKSAVHTWEIEEVFGRASSKEKEVLCALLKLRRRNRLRSWGDADPVPLQVLRSHIGRTCNKLLDGLSKKGYIRVIDEDLIDLNRTFNGKYRRLHPDKPTSCVLTKFCDPAHFLHPLENRGFTVREAARLQGFPDSFVFAGSHRAQARQVGNAVPPPLAKFIARWIESGFEAP